MEKVEFVQSLLCVMKDLEEISIKSDPEKGIPRLDKISSELRDFFMAQTNRFPPTEPCFRHGNEIITCVRCPSKDEIKKFLAGNSITITDIKHAALPEV